MFPRGLSIGLGLQLFPTLEGSTGPIGFMPFQAIFSRISGGLDAVNVNLSGQPTGKHHGATMNHINRKGK